MVLSLGPFLASFITPWKPAALCRAAYRPPAGHLQATCRLSVLQEGPKFGEVFAKRVWGEPRAFGRRQPVSESTETLLPIPQGGAGVLWGQPGVGS